MYIIFIRDKRQQIYSKIRVADKVEAYKRFEETINRKELYGRKLIAIIMFENTVKAFHSFKAERCERKIRTTLRYLQNILSIEIQNQSKENQFIEIFEARSMVNYRLPI